MSRRVFVTKTLLSLLIQFVISITCLYESTNGFHIVLMGTKRRGKNDLKRIINEEEENGSNNSFNSKSMKSLNQGKGQEITGVSLPGTNQLKGWEFGNNVRMVCANVAIDAKTSSSTTTTASKQQQQQQFYAIQGNCPRCGFDLWRGDLLTNDPGWDDLPRIACPTCSTTFSLKTGIAGPPLKRNGLQGFVSGLAKSATPTTAGTNAKAFIITYDHENEKVYCRER